MTLLYCTTVKKLKTIETIVNTELIEVAEWLNLNKLSLNTGKSEFMFFHSHQHSLNYDEISIKFNGLKLFPVDKIKYCILINTYPGTTTFNI